LPDGSEDGEGTSVVSMDSFEAVADRRKDLSQDG
jgi:hypothetical protein